jgi:hypothetical protein
MRTITEEFGVEKHCRQIERKIGLFRWDEVYMVSWLICFNVVNNHLVIFPGHEPCLYFSFLMFIDSLDVKFQSPNWWSRSWLIIYSFVLASVWIVFSAAWLPGYRPNNILYT